MKTRKFIIVLICVLGLLTSTWIVVWALNLTNASLLPGAPFGPQGMWIGLVLLELLLLLALAYRIQLLQAETARANRSLRDSEHRLEQFLEAMPVGVAMYDTAGRLDFINHRGRDMFNLPPDSTASGFSGTTLADTNTRYPFFVAGSEESYPLDQLPVSNALQTGQAASADNIEVRGSSQPFQLETWATPVFDEQGQLQYAITAFQDITHRKRLERELERHRERLEERVAERTRQLSAFVDMTMLVSEVRPLPEMIDVTLNRILEFCQCQAVVLHRLEDKQTTLRLVTQRGLGEAQQEQLQTIPLAGGLAGWLSLRQGPLLAMASDNVARLPGKLWLAGFQVYMGVQLRIGERVLGLLSYYRFGEQGYSLDEISLLSALTEQLAIIIENHRLRSEIEDIAVVAERQRLARDMHDSINQSLYSINLFTHAAREAGEDEDPKRLADSLARIETIAQASIKEMRLLLYQLQPDVLAEKGLAEALRLRFDSVERRLGIEVDYEVKGRLELPGEVAEGLYWTALEALNNSLKHARASQLTVRLTMHKPVIELEITDNGRGFEPERVNRGMGLANIRQRLEQLNGCLLLSSATGAGTKVEFAASVDSEPVKQREDVTG